MLHQLTKPPFEPLQKASLKHLTFKTVFLLVLGSGKHRSEIHAWVNRNIRHQSDWSKVSLSPSPCFLSKNQLAREGPESVAPVVIPALAPTLDSSLKEDRSLCPVRALPYYLDKTKNLRDKKELVFVSFKKNFTKDISPSTISSWIKQTVLPGVRPRITNPSPGQGSRRTSFRGFQGLSRRRLLGADSVSMPLEVAQYLHPVLPEGCGLG